MPGTRSRRSVLRTLEQKRWHLPAALFPSLHGYKSSFAGADALAAVTLLAIAVPEQLATSRLAGMPPISAFYAFIAGTVLFAILGSNPQMSVGADSTIAPLFAVGIAHLASTDSARYVDLVGILAVTVGVIVALVGLLRLGWIANFLSAPIITGFLGAWRSSSLYTSSLTSWACPRSAAPRFIDSGWWRNGSTRRTAGLSPSVWSPSSSLLPPDGWTASSPARSSR